MDDETEPRSQLMKLRQDCQREVFELRRTSICPHLLSVWEARIDALTKTLRGRPPAIADPKWVTARIKKIRLQALRASKRL